MMTEKSIEQEKHIGLILERLRAVEIIHNESANMVKSFATVEDNQPEVMARLEKESRLIQETREQLVKAVSEIQELVSSI